MGRIRIKQVFLIALLACSLGFIACSDTAPAPVILSGPTMGTSWSITLASPLAPSQNKRLEMQVLRELARINGLMSTYDKSSELSLFNSNKSTDPIVLHADTLAVLDTAIAISEQTDGAYDVTLGAVIDLWGFGPDPTQNTIPDDSAIRRALSNTGYSKLQRVQNTVRKASAELRIDLSSLAKGYAVDQIGFVVESMGVSDYVAEIGGELRTRGERANGKPWRIGIELPDGQIEQGMAVNDAHIASSGNYRNYREVDGVRYSHLIDGRTGSPVTHKLAAVSVLHSSTMLADAWATALAVIGPQHAMRIAAAEGLAVQLTVMGESGFELTRTTEFAALIVD